MFLTRLRRLNKLPYFFVMGSFIFSLIYIPLRAIFDEAYRMNTQYKIIILQTVFGIIIVNLPSFLTRRFMWRIPALFSISFMLFLWGAIFAGEVWEFYYHIPIWDDMLHLLGSMMAAMLGFSLIDILNSDTSRGSVKLSPFFISLFTVTFAISVGVLWELYEFTFDGLLGLNMQKFAEMSSGKDGTPPALVGLYGREALMDTMTDLAIDALGAVIVSAVGYISLRLNKGWLRAFKVENKRCKVENKHIQG